MSQIYTIKIASYQGIAAGHHLDVKLLNQTTSTTLRIDHVSYYWGAGAALLGVSAVCIDYFALSGQPTFAAYSSGPSTSTNPVYIEINPRQAMTPIAAGSGLTTIFKVANTSPGTQTMDVLISGILLSGAPPGPITGTYV